MTRDGEGPRDDVGIDASLSARELIFREVPEVRTRTWGEPDHESVSHSERRGLPRPVRSGTRYTDVHLDYRLAGRLRLREQPSGPPPEEE
ncbi:hypothetical protein [Nocardiopsis sp. MG754419]|uniref:hypothetical protein n=1 Tax=Nocardiopsis sp. MG754419 TaxID=2259865 RepID=UPI001BACE52B|nr:hypothetical protein [Nocardiopsis sp. MG754419]MBR8742364.1 hypothetical protein [Nocardiopsis sp. MG754419]